MTRCSRAWCLLLFMGCAGGTTAPEAPSWPDIQVRVHAPRVADGSALVFVHDPTGAWVRTASIDGTAPLELEQVPLGGSLTLAEASERSRSMETVFDLHDGDDILFEGHPESLSQDGGGAIDVTFSGRAPLEEGEYFVFAGCGGFAYWRGELRPVTLTLGEDCGPGPLTVVAMAYLSGGGTLVSMSRATVEVTGAMPDLTGAVEVSGWSTEHVPFEVDIDVGPGQWARLDAFGIVPDVRRWTRLFDGDVNERVEDPTVAGIVPTSLVSEIQLTLTYESSGGGKGARMERFDGPDAAASALTRSFVVDDQLPPVFHHLAGSGRGVVAITSLDEIACDGVEVDLVTGRVSRYTPLAATKEEWYVWSFRGPPRERYDMPEIDPAEVGEWWGGERQWSEGLVAIADRDLTSDDLRADPADRSDSWCWSGQ